MFIGRGYKHGWSSIIKYWISCESPVPLLAFIHFPFIWSPELHCHSWMQWHWHHHRSHPQWHQPSWQEANGSGAGTQSECLLIRYVVPEEERQVHLSADIVHILRPDEEHMHYRRWLYCFNEWELQIKNICHEWMGENMDVWNGKVNCSIFIANSSSHTANYGHTATIICRVSQVIALTPQCFKLFGEVKFTSFPTIKSSVGSEQVNQIMLLPLLQSAPSLKMTWMCCWMLKLDMFTALSHLFAE